MFRGFFEKPSVCLVDFSAQLSCSVVEPTCRPVVCIKTRCLSPAEEPTLIHYILFHFRVVRNLTILNCKRWIKSSSKQNSFIIWTVVHFKCLNMCTQIELGKELEINHNFALVFRKKHIAKVVVFNRKFFVVGSALKQQINIKAKMAKKSFFSMSFWKFFLC